jgi:integrase/recombinase XerD
MEIIDKYRNWLETLNYSNAVAKNNPRFIAEFMTWANINNTDQITNEKITAWFNHLSTRKHKRKEGGLSLNYLKGYKNALGQFSRFLRETHAVGFDLPAGVLTEAGVKVNLGHLQESKKIVLSQQEIQQLYEATNYYTDPGIKGNGLLAVRERAVLGLFYGCGLRKNEGLHVKISDLDFKQNLLYVRKGKNYKERYVPIAEGVKRDFIHYLDYARPQLIRNKKHENFITGWYGSPLKGSALLERVQLLASMAGIEKQVGLHTLRHSIATHLLQSGMKLEQIARFLGHSSLESTQIYTHISHVEQ